LVTVICASYSQGADIVAAKILDSTEEGKKVSRNGGSKFMKIFRRIQPPTPTWWEYLGIPKPNENKDS